MCFFFHSLTTQFHGRLASIKDVGKRESLQVAVATIPVRNLFYDLWLSAADWLKFNYITVFFLNIEKTKETFHINPQLHLILGESDEVIISLNQHSVLEPKVVGFSVYPLPKLTSSDVINKGFFKKNKSLVNSQYTNSRQVFIKKSPFFYLF